ncbi:hypothetical protein KNP414_01785 [Paenibacillus mucilaginosus KNP414]|uniref:Uncharacterized protein n=1 Tax=Paenibacillus mucilaginosus (strain KNP414) TaxID=1036673 RepID=F8FQJ2_PAEMK|nr:hypothetical protein KNP414_01785 [Paenibacillus mucilaginosus KNP414]
MIIEQKSRYIEGFCMYGRSFFFYHEAKNNMKKEGAAVYGTSG